MTVRRVLLAFALLVSGVLPIAGPGGEEVLRLRSGREVPLHRGKLLAEDVGALLREAEGFLKKGRLDLALDNCQAVLKGGDGTQAQEAIALMARIEEVERSSLVILKDGQVFRGKLRMKVRSDHLGLQGREEVPLWRIEQIGADYLINYSQVTRTFYLLTLLDIRFRDAPPTKTTITEEISLEVEERDGTVRKALLGYPYELLRKEAMGERIPRVIQDRVSKVIVYAALHEGALP